MERGEREEKEKKGRWKGRGKTTPIWIKGTGSVNEQRPGTQVPRNLKVPIADVVRKRMWGGGSH